MANKKLKKLLKIIHSLKPEEVKIMLDEFKLISLAVLSGGKPFVVIKELKNKYTDKRRFIYRSLFQADDLEGLVSAILESYV